MSNQYLVNQLRDQQKTLILMKDIMSALEETFKTEGNILQIRELQDKIDLILQGAGY